MAMTIQDYSILREVQSLDNALKTHMDSITSENARGAQIVKMREKRLLESSDSKQQISDLKDRIAALEKELFTIEAKSKQAQVNLGSASSASQMESLEKQIEEARHRCDELENQILELMSSVDDIQEKVDQDNEFLAGSLVTLKKVQEEILQTTGSEQKEVELFEKQIMNLLASLPDQLVRAFEIARKKHRFNNPITKIKGSACMMCRFILDPQTSSRVELCQSTEFCGQCDRLIAPLEA